MEPPPPPDLHRMDRHLRYLNEQPAAHSQHHRGDDRVATTALGDDRRVELKSLQRRSRQSIVGFLSRPTRLRGSQPSEPLRRSFPLRRPVESRPPGTAKRPDRPRPPEGRQGLLPRLFPRPTPEDRVPALVRKTETIEKELGSLSPVLEARLDDWWLAAIERRAPENSGRASDASVPMGRPGR